MKHIVATLAVLCMVTAAQAAVNVNIVNNGAPAAGLTSYTVQLVADTPAEATTAFDGRFDGDMNQVWELSGVVKTPALDRAVGPMTPVEEASDSHFLFLLNQLTVVDTPLEDGPGAGTYLAGDDGAGGVKNAVFGLKPATVQQTLDLAQIVISDNAVNPVYLNGLLSDGAGAKTILDQVLIPEPASMALLGLGGVVALIKRRR